jgi:4-oxalocrotonate tautomerase family enzyme
MTTGGRAVPIIQITIVRGREQEKVRNCIRQVARTVSETLNAPLHTVRVMVNEVDPDHFAVGDTLKSDATPTERSRPG